jgi:hypothetical protein
MGAARMPFALFALLLLIPTFAAAEKSRNWQTSTVLDSNRSGYFAGTVGSANTNGNISDTGSYYYYADTAASERPIYRVYQDFVIAGDQYVYLAQERLKWRSSKPADLTVNVKVKYAVEKRKLYVIDDEGKEHEMEIVKKTLRVPETVTH